MAEEETPFTWKGRDGLIYELSTCEDRHLRFFHRMVCERIREYETAREGNNLTPAGLSRLTQLIADSGRIWDEIVDRGLIPLPVRTPQEIALAKQRAQAKALAEQAQQAYPSPFGPGSQGVGGGLLGGLGAGIGGAFGSLMSGSGIQTVPATPVYNPRHKQFSHGKVAPVEDTTPVIETETPRLIRLPKKKKE